MLALLATVYVTVLAAELLGDKTVYTVGTLAVRHSTLAVLSGATAAIMAKMLVAVMFLGSLLAALPPMLLPVVSCATFLAMAIAAWLKRPGERPPARQPQHWAYASAISFAAIFFTEWGDLGQIAAAMLAAQHGARFLVWLGASLAMLTKILLALTIGAGFRRWVPFQVVRVVTSVLCLAMAILAVVRIEE